MSMALATLEGTSSPLKDTSTLSPQRLLRQWREGYEALSRHGRSFDRMLERLCAESSNGTDGGPSPSSSESPFPPPSGSP